MWGTVEPRLSRVAVARAVQLRGQVDAARIRMHVERLDEPRDHGHAPDAMLRAERYVTDQLERAGWQVERRPFAIGTPGANLLATSPGANGAARLLVGAHLDTVPGSPGADDNASGVAAVLELAHLLGPQPGIALAIFDQEESGLVGSRVLAGELVTEGCPPGEVIVLECLGYTSRQPRSQRLPPGLGALYLGQLGRMRRRRFRGEWTLLIHRRSTARLSAVLGGALAALAGRNAVMLARDPLDLWLLGPLLDRLAPFVHDFARSDHKPFWELGIPAVQVTDTANFRNPHYHQPDDTPGTLDYDRIAAIVAATAAVALGL